MNPSVAPLKILVAPLDWGLGHATRCVPIIRELLRQGCSLLLAGEGRQKALLQEEFPHLPFLELPGYRIEYASSGWGLAAKIVAQIPKLFSAIKDEQDWLKKIVETEKIHAVISDNRYGLYHADVHAVFVTHQLRIKAPVKLAEEFLQEINYSYINKFNECWIPDAEGEKSLAGDLSHPEESPSIPLRYVGTLSRFSNAPTTQSGRHLLILLSGPEPQRTLLEENLLEELKEYKEPVVLVRGLPGDAGDLSVAENVSVFNHLSAVELEEKIKSAWLVIARCGYSTVMDLSVLKKRSILIPTPGQTEQEYLADYLMKRNFAFCIAQKKFKLKNALALAENFPYQFFDGASNDLQDAVRALISRIESREKLNP